MRINQLFSGGYVNNQFDNLVETENYRSKQNRNNSTKKYYRNNSHRESREGTSSDNDEDDDDDDDDDFNSTLDQTNSIENSLPYSYHFQIPDRPLTEAEKRKQEMLANWSPEISESDESEGSLENNQNSITNQPKTPELSKNLANLSVIDRDSKEEDFS